MRYQGVKIIEKRDFEGRYAPVFIEKGLAKTSLRRNISGTVEFIGVTVSYKTFFSLEKQSKLKMFFLIMLPISDVND